MTSIASIASIVDDGREGSAAPSDSSGSDFYTDAPTQQPSAHTAPPPPVPVREAITIEGAMHYDETSSDMELSETSRPATAQSDTPVAQVVVALSAANHAGSKRKLRDADETADGIATHCADEQVKKRKVCPQAPTLSPALWQRIFTLLPPAMLCRCLRVSKEFKHLLTGVKAPHGQQKDKSVARTIDSEAIWIQSRKRYFPQLPRPLRNRTELGMLKLVGGQACQFCGKTPPVPAPATSVFNCGPGPNGVRVLFPFDVRTCGSCVEALVRKDVELLAEPISARLRLGITYAFRNEELHYVPETVRQISPGIPCNLSFSKVYYHPDLVAIQHEENDAQQLGEGAAEEWRKGLYNKGKDAMADSARWEKWEASLRLGANLAQVLREYDLSSFPRLVQEVQSRSAEAKAAQSSSTTHEPHPLPQPVHVFHSGYPPNFPQFQQQFARLPLPQQHPLPFPPPLPPHHLPFPLQPQQQQHHQRLVRNPQEVESARQARKAEIERRCRELEPAVEPGVLQHMESFQAAMQITTPLTDAAWDMLKPRILAQRESAEYAEHARATQLAALQAAIPSYIPDDIISKPAKEIYDREYEDAQTPLRKRLGEYADDIINGHWGGGKVLERDNVPIFAIQVLQHVRQRYTEDEALGLLSDLEPAAKQNGTKQGSPPPAPFLSLDNMKWVFDSKVRCFTDAHRKELFICAGCEEERKPKWFAFEGLVQHYGAKHTSTFSKGNIIVHWQTAEWPQNPPFHTRPEHWLKLDRRTSDMRKDHRARNTPHNNHDSQFQAPAAHSPSQNGNGPGNGVVRHDTAYVSQYHGQATSNGTYNAHSNALGHNHNTAMAEDHEAQHLKLANDSREVWDALNGVKDLLECIKVQTVLHHAVTQFYGQYHQKPALDLLTDALASHNVMRPLKNVTGLACKSCVAAGQNSYSNSYWTRIRGVKLFNTSSLVTHFKLMHQLHENVGPLDWVKDMIELPEKQIIKQLLHTPGMDDGKLALIAAAMPGMFPVPVPTIGHIPEEEQQPSASEASFSNLLGRLNKKQRSKANKKAQKACKGANDRDSSHEALPESKEDEYDPLRPALVAKQQAWDPAQFDTDARKPSEPKAPVAQPPPPEFNLDLATIAMLQSLTQASQNKPAPVVDRASRSPSVGRAHAIPAPKPPVSMPTSNVTPSGQPDIAAILAALTGQGQTATSPTSISNRSGSVPRQSFMEAYSREPKSNGKRDAHAPIPRHNAAQQAPPQPAVAMNVHELHAHNHRQYDENQHQHHSHTERAYSTGPQPEQHPPPPQPVPQYQYVYEDRQYAQASPHTATYREPPPPQYVQVPEHEYAPHGYQHERPAPQPIYVDQYGRPLIPIDAAPAPVQYLPNPYEQQHYARPQEQPVYTSAAPQPHLQPVYSDRRPVYYEQPASSIPPQRYTYDDRASVG